MPTSSTRIPTRPCPCVRRPDGPAALITTGVVIALLVGAVVVNYSWTTDRELQRSLFEPLCPRPRWTLRTRRSAPTPDTTARGAAEDCATAEDAHDVAAIIDEHPPPVS